jgi:hypothetical protein
MIRMIASTVPMPTYMSVLLAVVFRGTGIPAHRAA